CQSRFLSAPWLMRTHRPVRFLQRVCVSAKFACPAPVRERQRLTPPYRRTKGTPMKSAIYAAAACAILAFAGGAAAEEHVVEMLNKGEKGAMVFQPSLIRAAPGDTVK